MPGGGAAIKVSRTEQFASETDRIAAFERRVATLRVKGLPMAQSENGKPNLVLPTLELPESH